MRSSFRWRADKKRGIQVLYVVLTYWIAAVRDDLARVVDVLEAEWHVRQQVHELSVVLGVLQLVHEPRERALRVALVQLVPEVGRVGVDVVEADDAEAGPHEHRVTAEALNVTPHLRVLNRQPPAPSLARRQELEKPARGPAVGRRLRRGDHVARHALVISCTPFSLLSALIRVNFGSK